MKRDYQISKINTYDKYLTFHLTDTVNYSNGKASYITLVNKLPLNTCKEGDTISVDDEITTGHSSNSVFGENMVSKRSI